MTSTPLNFDIKSYTITDLKDIFELPDNFDENLMEIKETALRSKLLANPRLASGFKEETLRFINNAKIVLQKSIKSTKIIVNPYEVQKLLTEAKFEERTLTKHLNVDTRFRDNFEQSSSNFDINLSFKLTNVTKMALTSIEFPTTFYAISKAFGNNYFSVKITTTDNNVDKVYKAIFYLQDGNYSSTSIKTVLNNVNNYTDISETITDAAEFKPIFEKLNYTVDIDNEGTGTGKMSVEMEESTTITISKLELIFNEDEFGNKSNTKIVKKLGWMLGYRKEEYGSEASELKFNLTGEGLLNVTGPKYIYIAVDDNNTGNNNTTNFYSAFNSVILNKHILGRIPLSTFSFSFEIANNLTIVSTPREYSNPITIEKLGVKLTDEYGEVLDLNQMNLSFCLSFTVLYEG